MQAQLLSHKSLFIRELCNLEILDFAIGGGSIWSILCDYYLVGTLVIVTAQ